MFSSLLLVDGYDFGRGRKPWDMSSWHLGRVVNYGISGLNTLE